MHRRQFLHAAAGSAAAALAGGAVGSAAAALTAGTASAAAVTAPSAASAGQPLRVGVFWPNPNRLTQWYNDVGVDFAIIPDSLSPYLTGIRNTGRRVICRYDPNHRAVAEVVGWHNPPDEPDAVAGSRLAPYDRALYQKQADSVRAQDPRPVWGSLGQSMANLDYEGRAADAGLTYPLAEYCNALDVVTWFVYPGTLPRGNSQSRKFVPQNFDLVNEGMHRTAALAMGKPIYFIMEAARIYDSRTPTPTEMWWEANAALAGGAAGIIFFPHKTVNGFVQDWGLKDPRCLSAMRDISALAHG
jgi:hypothetical protein